jgi:hypothetical protein
LSTLTIQIDPRTENDLRLLSAKEGHDVAEIVARLLARAVRSARSRPVYDVDALIQVYAPFVEEDLALAESGTEARVILLKQEDLA